MNQKIYRHKQSGALYETTTCLDKPGHVQVYRQGGGYNHSIPQSVFDAEFEEAPPPVWKKAYFTVAGMKLVVPGFTAGRLWNGWQMPMFERAAVELLIPETDDPEFWTHHWKPNDPDTLVFVDKQSKAEGASTRDSEVEYTATTIVTEDGSTHSVYPVGDGWCWDIVRDESDEPKVDLEALHAAAGPIPQGNSSWMSVDSGTVTLEDGTEVNLLVVLLALGQAYADSGDQAYHDCMAMVSAITGIELDARGRFVTSSN